MWNKIKKTVSKLQGNPQESVANDELLTQKSANEDQRRAILEKEKQEASDKGEAWVAVLDTQINPDNIKNGFFELDWNNEFIEQLLDAGYSGESNEQIVDAWFKTLAQQILEDENVSSNRDMGYINVVPIEKGKSEVS
jgi:hypothetical protein|tara:strand:+ start:193 stop:606 length:414 start_codon:yes stop_codon:yes gene_type:complete